MNLVDQEVRPERPVRLRKHIELIPRSAFQTCAVVGQCDKQKFAPIAAQVAVQVRWVNVVVWTQLEHGSRLLNDIECQPARWFPCRNRLDKRACSEFAVANRPHPLADDASALGAGDSPAEVPLAWRRQIRK